MRPMPAARPTRDTTLDAIVAAARDCFSRLGVHRTRMDDIAETSGVVRQTLYRHVTGKDELVELSLLELCREMGRTLLEGTDLDAADLRQELADLVVRSIRIGRNDPEFVYLSEALPRRLGSFMTGPGQPMHQIVYDTYIPIITRGRAAGVIRADAGDHDIVEWIAGIITLFAPREDLTDHEERRRIQTFLIPAVCTAR
jgi:AcrR family transcriptional regulator